MMFFMVTMYLDSAANIRRIGKYVKAEAHSSAKDSGLAFQHVFQYDRMVHLLIFCGVKQGYSLPFGQIPQSCQFRELCLQFFPVVCCKSIKVLAPMAKLFS